MFRVIMVTVFECNVKIFAEISKTNILEISSQLALYGPIYM